MTEKNLTSSESGSGRMHFDDWVRALIYTPIMLYQFYLSWKYYNNLELDWVTNIGWGVMMISGLFGWLPIYEFRKKGEVFKGKSYVNTTRLVTSGVYSIVRHPQFLAGILLIISMMLISQHIHSVILGGIAVVMFALEVPSADRELVMKFGEPYKDYMEKVPALNFFHSIIRKIRIGVSPKSH